MPTFSQTRSPDVPLSSKRDRAARLAERLLLTRLAESCPTPRRLLVLNYHRLAQNAADECEHDGDVVSAFADDFSRQVRHLNKRFDVVTLDEAIAIAEGTLSHRGTAVLLTFDDGYRDCYTIAFPILRAEGAPATFFLVSSMVGSTRLPWWDQIATAIKQSTAANLTLRYPVAVDFSLAGNRLAAIRSTIRLYKSPQTQDSSRFLLELFERCNVSPPSESTDRLFLDWDEAAEMLAGGMDFGSHTHSHPLLSKLSFAEQVRELSLSRALLSDHLKTAIDVLAYPVGSVDAFNRDTHRALAQSGYRAAFSYYGGLNVPGQSPRYDLKRVSVDLDLHWPRFRLQTALAPYHRRLWS
ncbi:MAG TPA: polysaccharide deacetylase family protein [Vicinamibacterales bacterium]|jgi:peptidoglycan/xylan/chitin deacetylase (PgdA/CDA1 family)